MARGRINHERWIQFYLDYWIGELRLGEWRIAYQVVERLWDGQRHEEDSDVEFWPSEKRAVVYFSRHALRTKKQISEAAWHELAHLHIHAIPTKHQEKVLKQLWPIFNALVVRTLGAYIYHE